MAVFLVRPPLMFVLVPFLFVPLLLLLQQQLAVLSLSLSLRVRMCVGSHACFVAGLFQVFKGVVCRARSVPMHGRPSAIGSIGVNAGYHSSSSGTRARVESSLDNPGNRGTSYAPIPPNSSPPFQKNRLPNDTRPPVRPSEHLVAFFAEIMKT